MNISAAKEIIERSKNILISGHINPDGDCIGSMLALGLSLQNLGKNVSMVCCDGLPKIYKNLPGAQFVVKKPSNLKNQFDLAISLDCNMFNMLGETSKYFSKTKHILEIDHHEFREKFGDVTFIDHKSACIGEMVYKLLKKLKVNIDKEIAENLMVSLLVETNSFRLPSVTPNSFKLAYELLRTGIDFYKMTNLIYWSRTKESAVLSGLCMSRCKFLSEGKIAWSIVKLKDLEQIGALDEDADAVADDMRAIKDVKISVLFREKSKDFLRVSLRSKKHINIAEVAMKYGGGGHFDVAGCFLPNSNKHINLMLKDLEKIVS